MWKWCNCEWVRFYAACSHIATLSWWGNQKLACNISYWECNATFMNEILVAVKRSSINLSKETNDFPIKINLQRPTLSYLLSPRGIKRCTHIKSHKTTLCRHNMTSASYCGCDADEFMPLCGADGETYISPCMAGCKSQNGTVSISIPV